MTPEKKVVPKLSDNAGKSRDQVQVVDKQDTNAHVRAADLSYGDAGVKTPWENSHQITKGEDPLWESHSYNSQGRDGKTDWQAKGAERGEVEGPQQRVNPWSGLNTNETDELNQAY